jgi:hypothetical protein
MPFAHLFALLVKDRGQVRVDRRVGKRPQDVNLPGSIVDLIISSHHARDTHVEIADDHTQMESRRAILTSEHRIVQLVGNVNTSLCCIPHATTLLDGLRNREPGAPFGGPNFTHNFTDYPEIKIRNI